MLFLEESDGRTSGVRECGEDLTRFGFNNAYTSGCILREFSFTNKGVDILLSVLHSLDVCFQPRMTILGVEPLIDGGMNAVAHLTNVKN